MQEIQSFFFSIFYKSVKSNFVNFTKPFASFVENNKTFKNIKRIALTFCNRTKVQNIIQKLKNQNLIT